VVSTDAVRVKKYGFNAILACKDIEITDYRDSRAKLHCGWVRSYG
jgi:hypothetical protein